MAAKKEKVVRWITRLLIKAIRKLNPYKDSDLSRELHDAADQYDKWPSGEWIQPPSDFIAVRTCAVELWVRSFNSPRFFVAQRWNMIAGDSAVFGNKSEVAEYEFKEVS